jgi:hypothetical protein
MMAFAQTRRLRATAVRGEAFGLAGFDEALIEGFEGGAVLDGAQGGVQERFLDAGSGRADGPPRAGLTAVARVRCMARETGELALRQGASTGRFDRALRQGAESGQKRDQCARADRTDPGRCAQGGFVALDYRIGFDDGGEVGMALFDLGGEFGRSVWAVGLGGGFGR